MFYQPYIDNLLVAMLHANREAASAVIDQALQAGVPSGLVIIEILDPALINIGSMWEQETMSLAQGFVAAKIAEDTMLRCVPDATEQQSTKGAVVIGNIEDDFHSLGRRIVGLFLAATGWQVYDLGNDVLAEQFLDKALEVDARVVGASAMMQTTALNIRKLRDLIDHRGLQHRLKLAVGGAVFNWRPELVAEVGGDGSARNAIAVDALFRQLQAATYCEERP